MGNSDFLIQLVEIIKWPLVVVVLGIVFKKNISELITRIKEIKGGNLIIKIQEDIKEVYETSKEVLPEIYNIPPKKKFSEIDLLEMARTFPSVAVFESWKLVETSAKQLIERKGYKPDFNVERPYKLIEDCLIKGHLADNKTGLLFHELRQLRNKVAHSQGFTITSSLANQFVELAIRLRDKLDNIPA
jgi:hypothetical protein